MSKKKKLRSQRYTKGCQTFKKVSPKGPERIHQLLDDIAPDMAKFVMEFPFGDIYARPTLDMKTREMLTIASLVSLGNAAPQLKSHIHNCLWAGVTKQEIIEIIMQMSVYAGFPAAINGLLVAKKAFREMKSQKKGSRKSK